MKFGMFDFLFVNPSTEREARGTYNREPPTGLLILSAILRQHGYSVDLLDCSMEDDPKLTIRSIAKQYRGIGFTCLTNTYNRTIELIKIARSQASNALIVMGGPHASFMTETILRDVPEIDLVCKGEFEDSIVKLFRTTLIRPLSEALDKIDNFPLISKPQIQELPRGVAIRVDENNRILFYQDIKERPANNPFRIHDTGFPDPVDINSIPLPARDILIPKYYVATRH